MEILDIVYQDDELTIEAKAIFTYLFQLMDPIDNAIHSPPIRAVCADLNISEQRFNRHRNQLVDTGFLIKHHQGGEGMTLTYELGERF